MSGHPFDRDERWTAEGLSRLAYAAGYADGADGAAPTMPDNEGNRVCESYHEGHRLGVRDRQAGAARAG